jgi:F-type H+-transporting ATPase subunit delta
MDQISRVYARSLFEVARDRDALDRVREQLGQLAEGLAQSRDLQLFLTSPQFSSAEQRDGLRRAIEGADPIVENLLDVMVENRRLPLLSEVRRAFDELYDDLHRVLPVRITTAVPLDEATTARIGDEVGRGTGRQVQLTAEVDADLIGGIVLRVGNSILDASIRQRLENLRRQVATA